MNERVPKREAFKELSRDEVVSSLLKDPEDFSVLHTYVEKREKEGRTSKDTLDLNVEIAEIYHDAGFLEAAIESMEAAAEMAWQESRDGLYVKLVERLNNLKKNLQ